MAAAATVALVVARAATRFITVVAVSPTGMFYAQTAKQINQAKYSPHTSEKACGVRSWRLQLELEEPPVSLLVGYDVLFELHTKLRGKCPMSRIGFLRRT